jgi:outer membrane protein assembly factor BamA
VNFGLCDPPTIAALRSSRTMSPITVSATLDRTDNPISATRGHSMRAAVEHASGFTLSDYRYNRIVAEGAMFFPLGSNLVLGTHVSGGWVQALGSTESALGVDGEGRSIIHPRKRFFAGGSQSVRGFGEGQLGPRILTVPRTVLEEAGCDISAERAFCNEAILNDTELLPDSVFTARPLGGNLLAEASLELRFPLWGALGGALFIDAALIGESGLSDLRQSSFALTPGFGFRFATPAGPIRVDLGFNPFLTEDLPVVTEVVENDRNRVSNLEILRESDNQFALARRTFTPPRATGLLGFLSRFTLHLSIGQAF